MHKRIPRRIPRRIHREEGIALILSLIILLVLSTLAMTIAFKSNISFQSMKAQKRGQEAFNAAERCIQEARRMFETVGIEVLFFNLQGGQSSGTSITLPDGSYCRTGARDWFNVIDPDTGDPDTPPFIEIPEATKSVGRPIKHVSLPSGGLGGAVLVPTTFMVTGKSANDEDIDDTDPDINTGVEISVGFENFIPGGASNVY